MKRQQPVIRSVHRPPDLSGGAGRDVVLVLLHGSWHGAWVWEPFQALLAARGYESLAVNLRGHGDQSKPAPARSDGEVSRFIPLGDYARDVASALDQAGLNAGGRRYVFVAHSLAGRIVLHYLRMQRRQGWVEPAGIVFLAAVPPLGVLPSTLRLLFHAEHGDAVWDALRHLQLERLVNTVERAWRLFRHRNASAGEAQRKEFQAQLGDEALLGYIQTTLPSPLSAWLAARRLKEGGVPVIVLGGRTSRSSAAGRSGRRRGFTAPAPGAPSRASATT
jgi:pimeloyl-ACP methyl ester carboxylesterase